MLTLIMLVSCAGTKKKSYDNSVANDKKQLLGVILPTKDEPRWLQDEARFKEVLEMKGYNVEIAFSQGSSDVERENIENFIDQGADVIVICAYDGDAASSSVELAKAKGVKIIAYDRLITGTDAVDYFVTFNSVAVGKAQGNYLIEQAGNGKGFPLYLYAGDVADNNSYLFFKGAWQVLQPKIADGTFFIANSEAATTFIDKSELTSDEAELIIKEITTNWNAEEAKDLAEKNLSNIDYMLWNKVFILAPNDLTSRAIADVFTEKGVATNYYITGQDAEKESIQYIVDGKQSMTVFKDVRVLANDAIDMSVSLLSGQIPYTTATYNNGVVDIPSKQTDVKVIDEQNAKYELIASGYYTESDFTNLK